MHLKNTILIITISHLFLTREHMQDLNTGVIVHQRMGIVGVRCVWMSVVSVKRYQIHRAQSVMIICQ